jgi:hypothetical protein
MEFLKEILSGMAQFEDQEDDDIEDLPPEEDDDNQIEDLPPDDDQSDDIEDLPPEDGSQEEDLPSEEDAIDDLPDDQDDQDEFEGPDADDKEMDEVANSASEDPDRQGVIRAIKGAHLVYKRKIEDGTYSELWIYNSGKNMRDELKIRHAIVADTDIPVGKQTSPDGKQSFSSWTAGNAEMLKIDGLVN